MAKIMAVGIPYVFMLQPPKAWSKEKCAKIFPELLTKYGWWEQHQFIICSQYGWKFGCKKEGFKLCSGFKGYEVLAKGSPATLGRIEYEFESIEPLTEEQVKEYGIY